MHSHLEGALCMWFRPTGSQGHRCPSREPWQTCHAELLPFTEATQLTQKLSEGRSYFCFLQTEHKQQLLGARTIVALTVTQAGNRSLPTGAGWHPDGAGEGDGSGVCFPALPRLPCHSMPNHTWLGLRGTEKGSKSVLNQPYIPLPPR